MDLVEATQAQAALAVESQSNDYLLRRIFRWYSVTFHTPLAEIDELPIDYVLQQFFEYTYENMEKTKFDRIIKTLIDDKSDEVSDDEFVKEISQNAQKNAKIKKAKTKKAKKVQKELEGYDFLSAADVLKQVNAAARSIRRASAPIEKFPEIDMKFDSNLE